MEEKKAKKQEIIETEIQMGTVHPAALEPYRVRFFVEDEIIKDAEITIGVNHRGIERIMEGLPVKGKYAYRKDLWYLFKCTYMELCKNC